MYVHVEFAVLQRSGSECVPVSLLTSSTPDPPCTCRDKVGTKNQMKAGTNVGIAIQTESKSASAAVAAGEYAVPSGSEPSTVRACAILNTDGAPSKFTPTAPLATPSASRFVCTPPRRSLVSSLRRILTREAESARAMEKDDDRSQSRWAI